MKKLCALFLALILMSACSSMSAQDKIKFETYKAMYTDILNAADFKTSSNYFSMTASLTDIGNSTYRYDVFIDAPQVAMYDVKVLLIQDNGSLVISSTMMPSVGIFENKTFYMIPYQVNDAANYVKGFGLNGTSSTLPVRLKMVVLWMDAVNKPYKEYFSFTLSTPQ